MRIGDRSIRRARRAAAGTMALLGIAALLMLAAAPPAHARGGFYLGWGLANQKPDGDLDGNTWIWADSYSWDQIANVNGGVSDFDAVTGALVISGAAALEGNFGMALDAAAPPIYGALTAGLTDETEAVFEFRLDPNGITDAGGPHNVIVYRSRNSVAAAQHFIRLQIDGDAGGAYSIAHQMTLDVGNTGLSAFVSITDAPHLIRIEWKASTVAGADNGFANVYVDDVLTLSYTGKDNDTKTVTEAHFGNIAISAVGPAGSFFMDDCKVMAHIPDLSYGSVWDGEDGWAL